VFFIIIPKQQGW